MSKTLDRNIEKARKNIDDNNLFIEDTIEILKEYREYLKNI